MVSIVYTLYMVRNFVHGVHPKTIVSQCIWGVARPAMVTREGHARASQWPGVEREARKLRVCVNCS